MRYGWDTQKKLDAGLTANLHLGWNRPRYLLEPETVAYFALPGATGDVQTINNNIKAIKYGSGVVLPSVTAIISAPNKVPYQLITRSSVDLRPYVGFAAVWNDGTANLTMRLAAPGSVEAYGDNMVVNGDFTDPTGWDLQTGWSIADGKASVNNTGGDMKVYRVTGTIPYQAYKTVYDIAGISKGSLAFRVGNTFGTYRTADGTYTQILTARAAANNSGGVGAIDTCIGSVDNVAQYPLITADATGVSLDSIDYPASFAVNAVSFTVTIRKHVPGGRILAHGDSKSNDDAWIASGIDTYMRANDARSPKRDWIVPYTWAVAGSTVATMAATIDTDIAATVANPDVILLNWGANDVESLPAEATWIANYQYIITALHTKWPDARIYLTRPWRRGYATECNTLSGRIDTLIAANYGFVFAGDDERIWLEGGDDGATNSSDGIHYSVAGQTAKVLAVAAVIGLN